MQLVSLSILPLLFSPIHARVAATSTNHGIEISARDSPVDPGVDDKCVIGIVLELGDCDTYQTCTKSVKTVGDCSRQQSIHCSFDIPVGSSGEGGALDVLAIRCFPKSRDYGRHRFPNGTDIPEVPPEVPPEVSPEPVERPKCANTPLPKIPSSTCKAKDDRCTLETWYYVRPDCKPDPKTPELCQPIPKSECDAAADKCDPLPLPAEEAEKNLDKCIPETWYYVPSNCSPDAKLPNKCDPIPISVCNQTPDLCGPLVLYPPIVKPTDPPTPDKIVDPIDPPPPDTIVDPILDPSLVFTDPIDTPPPVTETDPKDPVPPALDARKNQGGSGKSEPPTDKSGEKPNSNSDKDHSWTWSSTPGMPSPPHRGDKYPPVDFPAIKHPKYPQS